MKRRTSIGFPCNPLGTDPLIMRALRQVELVPESLDDVNQLWRIRRRWLRRLFRRSKGSSKHPSKNRWTLREALYMSYRVVDVTMSGEPLSIATTFPHVAVITRSQSIVPG